MSLWSPSFSSAALWVLKQTTVQSFLPSVNSFDLSE
ncbi:rCG36795 [Rattus norvegicus]|uniref:RCG36795 n=1 Tax=Rattus norvegicus TaxID=10116 RepID=A6JS07_RAT|nr:rCG36795 [Rattus norvegicus]